MVIVFDLLGTIYSLDNLRETFQEYEMPPDAVNWWVTRLLQSAMAATLANRYVPLQAACRDDAAAGSEYQPQTLTTSILEQMKDLKPCPDAAEHQESEERRPSTIHF